MTRPERIFGATAPLIALVLSAPPLHAAEPFAKAKSYATTVMSYARGTRNVAMGATGTADADALTTGYFNPASLAWVEGLNAIASHQDWVPVAPDMGGSDARLTGGLAPDWSTPGNWRFGGAVAYSSLSSGEVPEQTIFLPGGTGGALRLDDYYVSIAGAASWTSGAFGAGVGGTVKYMKEAVADESFDAWAFDLGALATATAVTDADVKLRARVGAAATNLGNGASWSGVDITIAGAYRAALGVDAALPRVSVGSGVWRREVPAVALAVDYDRVFERNTRNEDNGWGLGLELSLFDLVQGRVGEGRNNLYVAQQSTTWGLGLGWAIGMVRLQLDYTHIDAETGNDLVADWSEDGYGFLVGARF